jgi:hypothetical protein
MSSEKENRTENVTIKSTVSQKADLEEIAEATQRSVSQVGFLLVQRGIELYKQDGLLVESPTMQVAVVKTAKQHVEQDRVDEKRTRGGPPRRTQAR